MAGPARGEDFCSLFVAVAVSLITGSPSSTARPGSGCMPAAAVLISSGLGRAACATVACDAHCAAADAAKMHRTMAMTELRIRALLAVGSEQFSVSGPRKGADAHGSFRLLHRLVHWRDLPMSVAMNRAIAAA